MRIAPLLTVVALALYSDVHAQVQLVVDTDTGGLSVRSDPEWTGEREVLRGAAGAPPLAVAARYSCAEMPCVAEVVSLLFFARPQDFPNEDAMDFILTLDGSARINAIGTGRESVAEGGSFVEYFQVTITRDEFFKLANASTVEYTVASIIGMVSDRQFEALKGVAQVLRRFMEPAR